MNNPTQLEEEYTLVIDLGNSSLRVGIINMTSQEITYLNMFNQYGKVQTLGNIAGDKTYGVENCATGHRYIVGNLADSLIPRVEWQLSSQARITSKTINFVERVFALASEVVSQNSLVNLIVLEPQEAYLDTSDIPNEGTEINLLINKKPYTFRIKCVEFRPETLGSFNVLRNRINLQPHEKVLQIDVGTGTLIASIRDGLNNDYKPIVKDRLGLIHVLTKVVALPQYSKIAGITTRTILNSILRDNFVLPNGISFKEDFQQAVMEWAAEIVQESREIFSNHGSSLSALCFTGGASRYLVSFLPPGTQFVYDHETNLRGAVKAFLDNENANAKN